MVEKVYVQLLDNIFPRHLSYITFFCIFQVERYSRTIVPICLPNPRDGYLINVRVEELGWLLMDKIHTRGVVFVESTYCWSVADHLCWLSFIDCWLLLYTQEGSSADISGFGVVIEPVSGALKHPTELQTARLVHLPLGVGFTKKSSCSFGFCPNYLDPPPPLPPIWTTCTTFF